MKKIGIINGPNLNLLGTRAPEIYGSVSFEDFLASLKNHFPDIEFTYFQSNIEGEIINAIQTCKSDALIINPAAYTHTSIAIADALATLAIPIIEVHISNIFNRESYRHQSYTSSKCDGCIIGFGLDGYILAVKHLISITK